jgi:hypothetical protein
MKQQNKEIIEKNNYIDDIISTIYNSNIYFFVEIIPT